MSQVRLRSLGASSSTMLYKPSMGKPESPLRVIYIGTIAPSSTGWWADLVDGGTHDSVYIQSLQGDREEVGSMA